MMNRRVILVGMALVGMAAGVLTSCSSPTENEEEPRPGLRSIIIKDNVFVADGATTLVDISDSTYTYNYAGSPPEVAVGDILIDSRWGGHLREVTEVVSGAGALTLQTTDASLVDAILRATFADSLELSLEDAGKGKSPGQGQESFQVNYIAPGVSVNGESLTFNDVELFSGTVRSKNVSAVVRSGEVSFSPTLHYSYHIEGSTVWTLSNVAKGELEIEGDVQVTVSDTLSHETAPVLLYSTTQTFISMIDRVPFVQKVTLAFHGSCAFDLQTAADASYAVNSSGPLTVGAQYSSGDWYHEFAGDLDAGPGQIQSDGHPVGDIRCFVRPEISISYYSVPGVRIATQPYLGLVNTTDSFFWGYEARTGVALELEADVEILDPRLSTLQWSGMDLLTEVSTAGQEQIGGLIIQSTPPGASIMLDGASSGTVSLDTLEYFSVGSHEVRLYLEDYNENIATVDWQEGFVTHSVVLTAPGWPRPLFTQLAPDDGAEFGDNVINISGNIQITDEVGGLTPFYGDVAVVSLNGVDQLIEVIGGNFSTTVSILSGDNNLKYRATGTNGNTGVSDPLGLFGAFVPDDIIVTLSWNSPSSDLDLHVWNPHNEHCYWANRQISEGFLDIDDVYGYGPETFTATQAITGTYIVKINSYDLHGDPSSEASVAVWLNGGQPELFGPFEFTAFDRNGTNPAAWWSVTVFSMNDGAKSATVEPLDPARVAEIEADMQNLPPKR